MSVRRQAFVAVFVTALVAGCATTSEPVSEEERKAGIEALNRLFSEQEQISQPLSMSDAMARAIKYNIDHRVKLMEKAMARTDIDVARMDLLPRIVASAGWSKRSNENASSSESIITGQESLEPSRSSDRDQFLADATLVWNLLDFGVSYVTAQQKADQVLVIDEQRRKAVQNIIGDVRAAYWKAHSAQNLGPQLDQLITEIESALERSQKLQEQGLQSRGTAARYQERLVVALRQMWRARLDLEAGRIDLARLMNLSPGTEFTLEPSKDDLLLPEISNTAADVEEQALTSRPELRVEDYNARIHQREVKKAMLRMLPGLEVELGAHYDDNPFLVNSSWTNYGVRVTWNIFNLLSGPAYKAEAEAHVEIDQLRRMAQSMAVLTQVHLAYETHRLAMVNFQLSNEVAAVTQRINEQVRVQREAGGSDELSQIRARARAIVAQLQRDQAFAELQNAVSRIQSSIGIDPLPDTVASDDLSTLAAAIRDQQREAFALLSKSRDEPEVFKEQPAAPGDEGDGKARPEVGTAPATPSEDLPPALPVNPADLSAVTEGLF